MIGLVDIGTGNIGSLGNALGHLGLPFIHSRDQLELERCSHLMLPGVGAFGPAIEHLRRQQLDTFLQTWSTSGRPLLGICLGMQLLLSESEEHGRHTGLDLIPGRVQKIEGARRRVHMGWNEVVPRNENPLIPHTGYAYFVHAYHCVPLDPDVVVAEAEYGETLSAVIRQGNVAGVQFHPEKSQAFGLAILQRFADGTL
ncbi:MAG: imidazole glycerol phosphate synthase subunit HisH [Fidelibacterota bacterium]|nr:MAG: imidazole glycerol phosphate synthase subunit HisH [Candidatus Neomarinimicrobiota bacterium]